MSAPMVSPLEPPRRQADRKLYAAMEQDARAVLDSRSPEQLSVIAELARLGGE